MVGVECHTAALRRPALAAPVRPPAGRAAAARRSPRDGRPREGSRGDSARRLPLMSARAECAERGHRGLAHSAASSPSAERDEAARPRDRGRRDSASTMARRTAGDASRQPAAGPGDAAARAARRATDGAPRGGGIREQRDQRVDRRIAAGAVRRVPPVAAPSIASRTTPARPSAAAVHSRAVDRAAAAVARSAPGPRRAGVPVGRPQRLFAAAAIRRRRPAGRAPRSAAAATSRSGGVDQLLQLTAATSAPIDRGHRVDRRDPHVRRGSAGEHAATARRCLHRAGDASERAA